MDKIVELYRDKYDLLNFYKIAGEKIKQNKLVSDYYKYYFSEDCLLQNEFVISQVTDLRVDPPIWFGEASSELRIMVLGREPRNTNNKYNIEKIGRNVFATPFAIEHWTNKNKYYRSFERLFKRIDVLSYFSDVVKEYEVKSSKDESDKFAKANFWRKAEDPKNLQFLNSEINCLKPNVIIGLGDNSYALLHKHFGYEFKIKKLIHPNARQNKITKENAWEVADKQLAEILNEI